MSPHARGSAQFRSALTSQDGAVTLPPVLSPEVFGRVTVGRWWKSLFTCHGINKKNRILSFEKRSIGLQIAVIGMHARSVQTGPFGEVNCICDRGIGRSPSLSCPLPTTCSESPEAMVSHSTFASNSHLTPRTRTARGACLPIPHL